jgi:hypothetical protein
MDYSDGEIVLPECHIVKRKDMKLFCFFLDVFIAGLRSATVVGHFLTLKNQGDRFSLLSNHQTFGAFLQEEHLYFTMISVR